jgi:CHAT domain-containing protein/Tfp pilus assembly protein PilF
MHTAKQVSSRNTWMPSRMLFFRLNTREVLQDYNAAPTACLATASAVKKILLGLGAWLWLLQPNYSLAAAPLDLQVARSWREAPAAEVLGESQQEALEALIRRLKELEERLETKGILAAEWGEIEAILKEALGTDFKDSSKDLYNLAVLYFEAKRSSAQGNYKVSIGKWEAIVASLEKKLGDIHPVLATSLHNLAQLYARQGQITEATSLYQRSILISRRLHGEDSVETLPSLLDLSSLYETQGRYGEAYELMAVATNIAETKLGSSHRFTITGLSNLASLHFANGRLREAEKLYLRVVSIRERAFGADHIFVASALNNLALLYSRQGRNKEAADLYRRSLSIAVKVHGENHPDVATIIGNLADLYADQGLYSEAAFGFSRALAIKEKVLGAGNPGSGELLNNYAILRLEQGRHEEARALLLRSLLISEKSLGLEHPATATRLGNLAVLFLRQDNAADAASLIARLNSSHANWLRRELPLRPRDFRQSLLAAQPETINISFALLHQDQASVPIALESRLNLQGLLAEIEQRQRLLHGSSIYTRQLGERLSALDRQIASIALSPSQRDELRSQRQQLEEELNRVLPALRIEPVTTSHVEAALRTLAPQGLLIEFQKYRPLKRDPSGKSQWGDSRYVALLLHTDGRIDAIPLGPAAPIDQAITMAHDASAANQADAFSLWAKVSTLLFKPLQPQLSGVRELFLSPDSELNRIPFAALPVGEGTSKLLSDVVQLRILTTGRDLVRLQTLAPAGASAPVVMANPQFDARGRRSIPASGSAATASASPRQLRSAAQQTGRRQWDPLPATEKEAQVLAPLLNAGKPITGDAASESRALALKSPRILHIASHGFFDPEQPAEAKQRPAVGQLSGVANPSPLSEDPLLRSGIVLAGANHPDADPNDDGHLTAAEVTGMDLRNTELVTLSACETGLGSVRSGEGVYGLQRALTVAGSRSTLLSLWKVGDGATAAFMAEFYKRLMAGEGRADALRNTQAAFRTHSNELYRDVYVWGAFQLTGDWRPLSAR